MRSKTVVITGATSGIGEVAAIRLAEQGATIIAVARDAARAEATLEKLRRANPSADHTAHLGDLSRLSEVRRVAREILSMSPAIHVLMNNAGAIFRRREVTTDGLEMTFALNHMAYFVMTAELLPFLMPGARIINTSSEAHRRADPDLNDLQSEKHYTAWSAYCRSKLNNIHFTRALARRLHGTGITANCLHPGFVATRFGGNMGGVHTLGVNVAMQFAAIPVEEGARTMIYLASSPEVAEISGQYFNKCKVDEPTAAARDDAYGERLWSQSLELAGSDHPAVA